MIVSNTRVECFRQCPYKYRLRYIDGWNTIPDPWPDDPLVLGKAIHTGINSGTYAAEQEYYSAYHAITDDNVLESMKMDIQIPKVRKLLPAEWEAEVRISTQYFIGFIDCLAWKNHNTVDIYDFKYSSHAENYKESSQLSVYKYFWEKMHPGKHVDQMKFICIPKVSDKKRDDEDIWQYRNRILKAVAKTEIQVIDARYDPEALISFWEAVNEIREEKNFRKKQSNNCRFCEYSDYCQKGRDYMILPKNERRAIGTAKKRKIWIYGAAFSGKTTFLDSAPNPLNLNTDGNISFVTMPFVAIKDQVETIGRVTNRKFAWEVLKETIAELEKKENTFDTIIIDLLEDTRESCRIYMYDKLGIQHESDAGFGKGWDIIKTEYLSTIRRFFNLNYENLIVVSHEDVSKDITKKNGQNITRIAPNIQDAVANKVAGMVDIVARVVVEDDGSRTLNFKSDEVVFGGGRLKGIKETQIPLEWDALMGVYDEANRNAGASSVKDVDTGTGTIVGATPEELKQEESSEGLAEALEQAEQPKRRSRRRSEASEDSASNVLTEDTFYRLPNGNVIKKHAGDAPVQDAEVITEDEFNEVVKAFATRTAEPSEDQPGTRKRRSRKKAEPVITGDEDFMNIPEGSPEEVPFN